MKKFFAILLALTMVFAMTTTAFARVVQVTGEITVTGAVAGKSYDVYKIFDLTYQGEGDDIKVAYTIDSDWSAFFATDGDDYIATTNITGSLSQVVVDGAVKYINITDGNVAEFAQAALGYASAKSPDKSATCAAGETTVVIDGLDFGYYLVYPRGAVDIKEGYASICSLSSTTPEAEVNVKATYPTLDKEVNDVSVEIGQVLTYTLTSKVPDTTGFTTYGYTVHDKMDAGLTFGNDVAVTFGGDEIEVEPTYANNGFELTFDMTQYQDYVGQEIVITYTAKVNKDAVIDGNYNEAYLTYGNEPGEDTVKIKLPVYTCAITVDKYDAKDESKKLLGAEFILKSVDKDAYCAIDAATGEITWVAKDEATALTTDRNGAATFYGIEAGDYQLIEVKAPEGYNLLTDPIDVTVDNDEETDTIVAHQTAKVANNTGSILPGTGGIGTTIFYVSGAALMLGAIILLVAKKKAAASEE